MFKVWLLRNVPLIATEIVLFLKQDENSEEHFNYTYLMFIFSENPHKRIIGWDGCELTQFSPRPHGTHTIYSFQDQKPSPQTGKSKEGEGQSGEPQGASQQPADQQPENADDGYEIVGKTIW